MGRRAEPSGVALDSIDAAVIKGVVSRGDRSMILLHGSA